mgnify:CR=1 FL=1
MKINAFKILIFLFLTSLFSREYIAIIDFEPIGVSELESKALTQRLTSEMIELGEYQVVERSEMKRLMEEQKFQYSGCVDLKCAVDIGKLIGAKYMVVGSISKIGSTYSIDSRMISVESGESFTSGSYNHKGEIDDLITHGMKTVAHKLCDLEYNYKPNIITSDTNIQTNKNLSSIKKYEAKLSIDSNPSNAFVYINSNFVGKTPIYFDAYPIGKYEIEILKDQYLSEKEQIDLVPFGEKKLFYEMQCIKIFLCIDYDGDGIGNINTKQKVCPDKLITNGIWVDNCQKLEGFITTNSSFVDLIELRNLNNELKYKINFNHTGEKIFIVDEGVYNATFYSLSGFLNYKTSKKAETMIQINHDKLLTIHVNEDDFK